MTDNELWEETEVPERVEGTPSYWKRARSLCRMTISAREKSGELETNMLARSSKTKNTENHSEICQYSQVILGDQHFQSSYTVREQTTTSKQMAICSHRVEHTIKVLTPCTLFWKTQPKRLNTKISVRKSATATNKEHHIISKSNPNNCGRSIENK